MPKQKPQITPAYMDIKQTAQYAGVSRCTVMSWIDDGLQCSRPGPKIYRIKQEWIDIFLAGKSGENATDDMDLEELKDKVLKQLEGMR